MSQVTPTSDHASKDKIYIGVIVILIAAVVALILYRPVQEKVVVVDPNAPPESIAIQEGWGSFTRGGTLEDFIAKNRIVFLVAIDDKLQSYIGDANLSEIPLCSRQVGATGVAGTCADDAGVKRLRDTTLTFTLTEGSHIYCGKRGGYKVCK